MTLTLGEQRELAATEPIEVRQRRAAAVLAAMDAITAAQLERERLCHARQRLLWALSTHLWALSTRPCADV